MRIISGTHKGRKLQIPKNLPVRPTTDFAKEALFNLLNNQVYFDEIHVLDLCTGTGSIAFEFASRGVLHIDAVDADRKCVAFVKNTAAAFDFPIIAQQADLIGFLEKTSQKWDVIFADPPYDIGDEVYQKIPKIVFERKLLKPEGILIMEHSKRTDVKALPNYVNSRSYSNNVFSFFEIASE
ncbi:MAG: RsmD family RNA methyltransferase [Flavobacteriaceae bacterium]|nr:RsmD family RNA methyltransferase [Flavobacteriaceae bacterium]